MGEGIRLKYHKKIAKYVSLDRFSLQMGMDMHEFNIQLPASLTASILQKQYLNDGKILPKWKLSPKNTGKLFAIEAGLKTPKT